MTEKSPEPNIQSHMSAAPRPAGRERGSASERRHAYTTPQVTNLGSWATLTLVMSVPIPVGSVFRS